MVAPRDAMAAVEAERARIIDMVRKANGDLLLAADALGMPYASLRTRLAEMGIKITAAIDEG